MQAIEQPWFARSPEAVAPDLIGCLLVRQGADGTLWRGQIVETEAYGADDPACHAYRKQTPRNAVMFGPAGFSYVYFIYGMYHCFNIVTEQEGRGSAVLIRALALLDPPADPALSLKAGDRLAAGPGKLCRYLDIDRRLNGLPLAPGQPLWLAHPPPEDGQPFSLVQTTRIGLSQGAERPWRWYMKDSPAVSKR